MSLLHVFRLELEFINFSPHKLSFKYEIVLFLRFCAYFATAKPKRRTFSFFQTVTIRYFPPRSLHNRLEASWHISPNLGFKFNSLVQFATKEEKKERNLQLHLGSLRSSTRFFYFILFSVERRVKLFCRRNGECFDSNFWDVLRKVEAKWRDLSQWLTAKWKDLLISQRRSKTWPLALTAQTFSHLTLCY